MKRILLSLLLFAALPSTVLHAQTVPSLINYQGRLTDTGGNPVSGNVTIAVKVHGHETNEDEQYSESIGSVAVNNGIYSFQFGSGATFPAALANTEAWLEVSVDSTALSPRQRLIAVPYAIKAGSAGSVEGPVVAGNNTSSTPASGAIRWTGSDLEVFNGTEWVSLVYDNGPPPPPLVNIEMVTVGNPGNVDDPGSNGLGGNSGSVATPYKIGKYEVTNSEYTAFLNAVDPTGANALALYNSSMSSNTGNGGITLTPGNADGSKYAVKAGFENKPVVYVSFFDTMRFCNWLHNGAQPGGDTENGAYTLEGGGATPTNGTTVERNSGAKFTLPTEDEWYKAAYHQPSGDGGDTDNYWLYPTGNILGNDNLPSGEAPPGTAPPAANYTGVVGSVTEVGAYATTVGYYGTFDMAGNVREWVETLFGGSSRVLRGGSWFDDFLDLQADFPNTAPPVRKNALIGFRISSPYNPPPPLVNIEMVTVGNPGNVDDTGSNGLSGNSGSVAAIYNIGKYEVTNTQYTAFLNAVDPTGTNALALHEVRMGTDIDRGGIPFIPTNADGSKYAVKAGYENKPVVYVSFYDTMRFCNWLHNGAQPGGDTENGAYTLVGGAATPTNGTTVERNSGAKFTLPTEDEWYKAAYHQPSGDGGDTDSYWFYPTQDNTPPNGSSPPGTAPAANYSNVVGSVTEVGAYATTVGYYGTFDMAGNAREWVETLFDGSSRVLRGGSWGNNASSLLRGVPYTTLPWDASHYIGFRISSP